MSNDQTIKIKLKTAHVEIEYEGSEGFLRSDLLSLITEVTEIHKANPPIGTPLQQTNASQQGATSGSAPKLSLSITSIAAKLNVKTGYDLVLAASAYLTLTANHDTFSRKEILDSMKTASTFYKKTYSSNFSKYLDGLVKDGKILQQANDLYAIPGQVRSEMESKLGN